MKIVTRVSCDSHERAARF